MKKAVLFTILALCLGIFVLGPSSAEAAAATASGSCGTNLTWTLTDDGVLTVKGTGRMTDFNFNYTNTLPPWFDYKASITSIVIEDGVERIGNYAFRACFYVTSVSIPDSVTSIGAQAFYGCSGLTKIVLPKNLATVPTYGFYNCSKLTEVVLPENLVTIGTYAFSGCSNLPQITIPYGTKNIYEGAFNSCGKLKTVYKYAASTWSYTFSSSPSIKTLYRVTYMLNGRVHSTEDVLSGGNAALLQEPADSFYEYSVDGAAWTGKKIAQDCTVTVTPVPAYTVTYTGAYTGSARIKAGTNAVLPTPPDYYEYTFTADGKTWTGKNITGNVTVTVTQKATCGENLTWSINSSGTLVISGSGPMYHFSDSKPAPWYSSRTSIKALSLPAGLTTIGSRAFMDCTELTRVSLSSKITSVGSYAFAGCTKLSSVTLPSSLSSIPSGMFYNCTVLKSVSLPAAVTSIGAYAFENSGIESFAIPEGVTRIEEDTFAGCTALKTITIPDSVAYIDEGAFSYNNLTDVKISSLTAWLNIRFSSGYYASNPLTGGANLVVNGSVLTELTVPSSVTQINPSAFYGYRKLTKVIVPSHVTSVGKDAFYGCTNLQYAKISSSSIGVQVFYHCSNLRTVILDGALTTIPDNAFSGCTSLTSVDIPDTVTSIAAAAFYDCSSLAGIHIPSRLKTVGAVAFYNCTALGHVYLTDLSAWLNASLLGSYSNPFQYGARLYLNGSPVTHLVVPDDVTDVVNLYGCTGIQSMYVYKNVQYFSGTWDSPDLETVYAPVSSYVTSYFPDGTRFIYYCTVDYVKNGTVLSSQTVNVGETSALPQPPTGQYYYFEANGEEWDGKNVTHDATVSVYDGALITYRGDHSGTDIVKVGGDAVLPEALQGLFVLESGGKAWSGTQITGHTTVDVIALTPFAHNPNAGWRFQNGVLHIGGTGTMPEGNSGLGYPWYDDRLQIVEVNIGDGITNIGNYAFDSCIKLESVTIGAGVETLGTEAFDDCPKLSGIVIPDSVRSIGAYAFEDCYALSSVTIGTGLETIGQRAFRYNDTAEFVIHEENPYFKAVDGNIFSKDGRVLVRYATAKKDTAYVIPEGVTTIGFGAFESAVALTSVTIPTTVTSIEDSAFWLVDSSLQRHSLSAVFYAGTPAQWKAIAIQSYNDALLEAKMNYARLELVASAAWEKTPEGYTFDIVLDWSTMEYLKTAALITALYDSDGRFITLAETSVSPSALSVSVPVETAETAATFKIISLADFEIPIPLCETVTSAIN